MRKNEQKTADSKSEPKKAYIWNLIMLFVLAICIILVVFAWFSLTKKDVSLDSVSLFAADNLDITFNTYPGTVTPSGAIVYEPNPLKNLNNDDFNETENAFSMFPGEKKYFKTEISNNENSNFTGTFYLQNVLFNSKLVTTSDGAYISFSSTAEDNSSQQSFDLVSDSQTYIENGEVSSVFRIISLQPIYSNLSLPAGATVTVYWYVTLNGSMVDNSMMEAQMMKLRNVKFIPTNLSQ